MMYPSPDLGAVPDLDVPVYLPDLPGVAEISFEEAMGSIAPSFLPTCDILPELPDLGKFCHELKLIYRTNC